MHASSTCLPIRSGKVHERMWGWGSSGVRTAGLGGQRVNQCICVASVGVVVARVQATGCRLVRSDMGRAGCLPRSTLLILSRTGSERRAEGVRSTVCTRYVTGTPALRAALRLVRLTTIQLWLKLVHALYQQQNTMPGALESQNKVSKSQGFFFLFRRGERSQHRMVGQGALREAQFGRTKPIPTGWAHARAMMAAS